MLKATKSRNMSRLFLLIIPVSHSFYYKQSLSKTSWFKKVLSLADQPLMYFLQNMYPVAQKTAPESAIQLKSSQQAKRACSQLRASTGTARTDESRTKAAKRIAMVFSLFKTCKNIFPPSNLFNLISNTSNTTDNPWHTPRQK